MATPLQANSTAVVGYFATGDGAHRAIHALIENGFIASEIGAAFHVGSHTAETQRIANVGGSLREDISTTNPVQASHSTSMSSAQSGSNAVQFGVLGPGSGTPSTGAHKPGPIPGSDLSNTGLPSDLKSTLPHESDLSGPNSGTSWSSRLDPVFSGARSGSTGHTTKESQNFGTGEGSLQLTGAIPYSREGFEHSFQGYGLEPAHARSLSESIGRGGAVITVHAHERSEEAERILEAHGARVRFSPDSTQEGYADPANTHAGVEVFGTLGQHYPHTAK
jgi:hypothetical protein